MIERQDSLLGNNLGLNNTKTHYIKKGVLAKNKEASKPAEKVEGALCLLYTSDAADDIGQV